MSGDRGGVVTGQCTRKQRVMESERRMGVVDEPRAEEKSSRAMKQT